MDKKRFIIAIVIYSAVFVSLTVFLGIYHYNHMDVSSSTSDVKTGLGLLLDDISKRFDSINFTRIFKPLQNATVNRSIGGGIMIKSCNFKTDLYCAIFRPDKKSGQFLFNFRNDMDKKIVITGAKITGGTNCETEMDLVVNKYEDFYMVIKRCKTTSVEADMEVFYYNFRSSSEFIHSVKGKLAVR